MKRLVVFLSLCSVPALAQDVPPTAPVVVARTFVASPRALAAAPAPAPTAVPRPTEPQNADEAAQAFVAFVKLARAAAKAGTLATVSLASLALVYLLMFVVKTLIKDKIVPDEYGKAMTTTLTVLSLAATGLGYLVAGGGWAGAAVGVASGLGAAASSIFHDVIDGLAPHRKEGVAADGTLKPQGG